MVQLGLTLARRTDVNTSHEAAAKVGSYRAKHEAAIFGAICEAGERGATAKDIAAVTGLTDVQVSRRLGSMGERGLIVRGMVELWHGEYEYAKREGCCVWRATK